MSEQTPMVNEPRPRTARVAARVEWLYFNVFGENEDELRLEADKVLSEFSTRPYGYRISATAIALMPVPLIISWEGAVTAWPETP